MPVSRSHRARPQGEWHPEAGHQQRERQKVTKLIRDEGPKGVKTQIQGEEIRVTSKNDLQSVIALLKGADLEVALQFVNYR